MNWEKLDKYVFVSDAGKQEYTFYSRGPTRDIRKVVIYYRVPGVNKNFYNLSFGDWDKHIGKIDDEVVSNNGDRQKILATVAATVVHFTAMNPKATIMLCGSTASRTRLYQMAIASYYVEIGSLFEVKGLLRIVWEPFKKGTNYRAFLITRKIN